MTDFKIWAGQRITESGAWAKLPLTSYHRGDICDGPSVSSSGLRTITWQSEADFWDCSPLNPQRQEIDEDKKRHFVLGRAMHHLVLGEPFFSKLFVIRPEEINGKEYHWNNKDWKKWEAEQRRRGLTILKQDEAERVRGMMMSLGRYPLIQAGMLNGAIERSLFWKDKRTGVWLKSRPDVIPNDGDDVVDLKTSVSVQRLSLMRTVEDYAYYQQGALIREGWRQIFGRDISSFTLVFVQSKRPYSCRTVTLEPEDLDRGEKLNNQALDRFVACMKSGIWPGPGGFQSDAQSLALSTKARERIDDMIKFGNLL
jgi:hypothetical protein